MTKKVYLGKIISSHGIKGLLKIEFYNRDLENLNYNNKTYIEKVQINLEKKFTKGKLSSVKLMDMIIKKKLFIFGKKFDRRE